MATWLTATNSQHHKSASDHHPSHTHHTSHVYDEHAHGAHHLPQNHDFRKDMFNGLLKAPSRSHTPLPVKLKEKTTYGSGIGSASHSQSGNAPVEHDAPVEEDALAVKFKSLYDKSESRIAAIFDSTGQVKPSRKRKREEDETEGSQRTSGVVATEPPSQPQPPPSSALTSRKRKLDDDYDDYDDDDEDGDDDEEEPDMTASPLRSKSSKVQIVPDRNASPAPRPIPLSRPSSEVSRGGGGGSTGDKEKDKPEDARKKLEEAKLREVETVKNMSRTLFFTLENDADAMLDQQRLDEAERRAEVEAENHAKSQNTTMQQGSLSSANLGASSLTLKNLIARIDQYRSNVSATESELRALMSEVRKNRSKWASEDKVGQEELYEAAEKVLNELKAQTEHSTPFLAAVKKKDAPDYSRIILHPMDLGTMTKKLKQLSYKSKREFVDDLHLIWANCLKYNSSAEHPMRKHALHMRKETDKLVPLIPEIVIRDRAEVEAEEKRQRIANGDIDGEAEDSDDEPIMASRGRKAPSKKTSKAPNAARKASVAESTPVPDTKPSHVLPNGIHRAESDIDTGSQGHSTPPPGVLTPTGLERFGTASVVDTQSEMPDSEVPGLLFSTAPPEVEDEDHRLWKQRTKKERAQIAAARHRLFRGDKLNPEEEALLRSRSAMRRWQHLQPNSGTVPSLQDLEMGKPQNQGTLAEGLDTLEDSVVPDYYDIQAALPDLNPQLQWLQDTQGNLIEQQENFMCLYPQHQWVAPSSKISQKMAENMKQIQDTRKIVSKIGVVKQMQLQSQIYQNQFTKFEPAPLLETDIQNHVMNDAGPLIAPWLSRAALTRSIAEIFFHAGFEEFQPSALEAITDISAGFLSDLSSNLSNYLTEDKIPLVTPLSASTAAGELEHVPLFNRPPTQKPAVPLENAILHTLHTSGLSLAAINEYATDEIERTTTRLSTMHTRMRAHYADLLRPAVTEDTSQGQGTFDSGEQFTSGDFAEDLGEDFFGFKELGLDKEFGLINMSVPLHLLRNRLANNAATNNNTNVATGEKLFVPPPPYPKVNVESIEKEIGLVKDFFRRRLKENGDRPLPEDMDLPVKQRKGYGKPRIPATGKIESKINMQVSPQKKASARPTTLASKSSAPNGVVKAKLKSATHGLERRDSTFGDGTDHDVTNVDGDGPSPSAHINGAHGDDDEDIPLKARVNKPSLKTKSERKKSAVEENMHNEALPNGTDLPTETGAGMHGTKDRKGQHEEENGMMSPESL